MEQLLPDGVALDKRGKVQMQALGELVHACLGEVPANRPSMVQVVSILGHVLAYAEEGHLGREDMEEELFFSGSVVAGGEAGGPVQRRHTAGCE